MNEYFYQITYTHEQAQAIVGIWNEYAKPSYQLEVKDAHKIMTDDNFDDDIIENGYAVVEVPAFESKSGNPITFNIYAADVTLLKVCDY